MPDEINPKPALWPTAWQAIMAGQSPAIPGAVVGEAAENAQIEYVLRWMLDESDDIEGTALNLGAGQPKVWVHTTEQVREWLRERLPDALRTPSGATTAQPTATEETA